MGPDGSGPRRCARGASGLPKFLMRRIHPDGRITTIGGIPGEFQFNGDGLRADSTAIDVPEGIVAMRDGRVMFGDLRGRIRQIAQHRLSSDERGRPATGSALGLVIDTSALVAAERGEFDPGAVLSGVGEQGVVIPVIVYAELLAGVRLADTPARARDRGARRSMR